MVVHDEVDFSRPDVMRLYEDRTAASTYDWRYVIGTPTLPKFGMGACWEDSSQSEWLVRCPECGDEAPLEYPVSFALDAAIPFYICRHGHELTREDIAGRAVGRCARPLHLAHLPRAAHAHAGVDRRPGGDGAGRRGVPRARSEPDPGPALHERRGAD